MKVLPTIATVVTLTLPLAGCRGVVADYKMLESFAKSPTTTGVVEDCGASVNVDRSSQAVTINGERFQVERQGIVMRCSDRAWVRDRTMPPLPPMSERRH